MSKPLLVFAHRGEALAFLDHYQYRTIDFIISDCFECDDHFLIITGEGVHDVSEKTAAFLGAFYKNINLVFNIGICGSLLPNQYHVNEIIEIETIYAEDEFKSYPCHQISKNISRATLVTAKKRVLNRDYAKHLSVIADLTDRESWGVASAVQKFKLPFTCFKIISDHAENSEICQIIKEQAPLYSEKLFHYYQKIHQDQSQIENSVEANYKSQIPDLDMFYFTTAQSRLFENLIKDLLIKNNQFHQILLQIKYHEITNLDLLPKARTAELLKRLTYLLNPMLSQIESHLKTETHILENGHFKVHFSQHFENDTIMLHGKIEHEKNIHDMIEALKKFNYQKVIEILHGKFHV